MGIPPPAEPGTVVELDEEVDGETEGSRNYRFSKIGVPVSVVSDATAVFDPKSVPYRPVALSLRFRLLFVVHLKGFCVTRTSEVISVAENIKDGGDHRSIQEFCLVDVPMEHISLISLSSDDALLAACVANTVHFFAVSALLHKEKKPSFSVSLDDSNSIKDMIWAKKLAKAFVILSTDGKLYNGSCQGPVALVMDGVDCVDWSSQENYIVVAKKNVVIVMSPQCKEKSRFLLPFKSVVDDSDVTQVIKVDSIQWIRPDCIAVGCLNLSYHGEEVNYFVQFINIRAPSIEDNNVSSKPVVISFNDIMLDSCPKVPDMNGLHLLLNYLENYGLAFISIRNLSRQVGLICWLAESGNDKAAIVEILNDSWALQINFEDNENNTIVGLAVDKLSQNKNARCIVGDDETEVSPCCVIICLTIDGNISVFHFASSAEVITSQDVCDYDEEDPNSSVSINSELPQISSSGGEQNIEPILSTIEPIQQNPTGHERKDSNASTRNDLLLPRSDGNRDPPPSIHPDSRDSIDPDAVSRKPLQLDIRKESTASSFPSRHLHNAVHAPRNHGNVEEMTRALDNLLKEIEKGGFTDSSVLSQGNSVKELEENLWVLSDRCRTWRGLMDDKLREVNLLLDKTVQVMTKKVNIEVILRQTMDSRYWELWDRQQLSYEMESKLKSILQREQALTSQLIELERHFNTLEFNKYGEDREFLRNQMVLPNLSNRNSRKINSVQSLSNTVHAQLEAAEHLSGCLSEQMASLKIESSGKHDMKRQIFESVGLHYSGSNPSPLSNRAYNTPVRENIVTSLSLTAKEESKVSQAGFEGNIGPKTARRQQCSLDQSWASVDPPKTTMKRMPKEDYWKASSSDKQYPSPDMQKKSEIHSASNVSRDSLNSRTRGTTGLPRKQHTENSFRSSGQSSLPDRGIEDSSGGKFPALLQSVVQKRGVRSGEASLHSIDESSKSNLFSKEKIDSIAIEPKLGQKSSKSVHSMPAMFNVASGSSVRAAENKEASLLHHGRHSTLEVSSNLPVLNSKKSLSPESSLRNLNSEPWVFDLSVPFDLKKEIPSLVKNSVPLSPSETISNSTTPLAPKAVLPISESNLKSKTPVSSVPSLWSADSGLGSSNLGGSSATSALKSEPSPTSIASKVELSHERLFGIAKNVAPDHVEEMEEEASETSREADISLGSLGSFGIGSNSNSTAQNTKNPFGVSMTNTSSSFPTFPSYSMPTPGGELFRPASFSFASSLPPQPVLSAPSLNISSAGNSPGAPGFGHQSTIGAGQQAIGSVLGSFGQSRQLGSLTLGSGFGGSASGGTVASGGFAGLSSGFGGFAGAATASQVSGGGFGAFSNQQVSGGGGGFSSFGGSSGVGRPPSDLFTQMRK